MNYLSVGRWGITVLPPGWMFVPEFGIRQMPVDAMTIVANIALSQDPLRQDATLSSYIGKQRELIQGNYPEARLAGPQAAPFERAEEAYMLLIRHAAKEGIEMLQVQHYVRVGSWIGIVTLTTPEQVLRTVRPDHESFLKGLYILQPQTTN